MPDRPPGPQLLEAARETLLKELLPRLPHDQAYPALMVANAMRIAAREADQGAALLALEMGLLAQLYRDEGLSKGNARSPGRLAEFSARLAREVRAGRFDGESGVRLRALLLQGVCARLRISNPRYLESAGLS